MQNHFRRRSIFEFLPHAGFRCLGHLGLPATRSRFPVKRLLIVNVYCSNDHDMPSSGCSAGNYTVWRQISSHNAALASFSKEVIREKQSNLS